MNVLILLNAAAFHRPFYSQVGVELAKRGHTIVYAVDSHYTDYLYPDAKLDAPAEYFLEYFREHGGSARPPTALERTNLWLALLPDFDRFSHPASVERGDADYHRDLMICMSAFFWDLFERYSIDRVVYEVVSNAFSYVAYLVANARGAKFVGFTPSRLPKRLDVSCSQYNRNPSLPATYRAIRAGRLRVQESVRAAARDYIEDFSSKVPDYMVTLNRVKDNPLSRYLQRGAAERVVRSLRYQLERREDARYAYQIPSLLRAYPQQFTWEIARSLRLRRLRASYYREPDLSQKYFVYPMGFHPESATSVDAPYCVDELSMVRNIAISVPNDWLLYVKDHRHTSAARQPMSFYDTVRRLPNVVLVDPSYDSKKLIALSMGVIASTGTMGYEAIVLGKPAIVFGQTFYDFHPMCIRLESFEGAFDALRRAAEMRGDPEDVKDFVAAYYLCTYPGTYDLELNHAQAELISTVASVVERPPSEAPAHTGAGIFDGSMCGIVGFFDLDEQDGGATAAAMCATIRHRGPDGEGAVSRENVTLGMVRLAIVDVANGNQPMLSDDGQVALVYNGEVYNAPALRKRLESEGVSFRTRSDTEVILRLYERDPERVEEHLVGMWAFAVHDRRRKVLSLSRDRFGIKPLFVADTGKGLAFASELRALEPVRGKLSELFAIDRGAAHAMLSWAYVPNTDTIYAGIKRLAPASRLDVDLSTGVRRTRRYWHLDPSREAAQVRNLGEACDLVEPMLRRAVTEHLESDVPVAAFLSGGIDSSLVTSYAALASSRPVRAFTIGFSEARFDESPFARATSAALGVDLHVEYFDEETARRSLGQAMAAYDEPFGDSSSLATYLLSSVVGKSHKVALGGDGGDEVFAGYKKHRIIGIRDALRRVPALGSLVAKALRALPARTDRTSAYSDALRVARRVSRALSGDDAHAFVALSQVASMDLTANLVVQPSDPERFERPLLRLFEQGGGSQLRRTLTGDLDNALPNDMLTKVDRASMACHLEARVPFLDHRLVEVGVGLPPAFTLRGQGKRVLRALHERKFGPALARRKKMGFGVPVERWMRGPLEGECARVFARDRLERYGVLSSATLGDDGWKKWRESHPQILWHAFALAVWCENNLA